MRWHVANSYYHYLAWLASILTEIGILSRAGDL